MAPQLENSQFLNELTALFEGGKESRSVWLTLKRMTHPEGEKGYGVQKKKGQQKRGAGAGASEPLEPMVLVRATDGKKLKLSTVVHASDVASFRSQYANIMRAQMDGLKRKQRRKKTSAAANKK